MKISRSGRTSDVFGEALKKIAKQGPGTNTHIDQRLKEDRKEKGQEHKEGTDESLLSGNRKRDPDTSQKLTEKKLREHNVDEKVVDITEKRLSNSSGGYPHRNEDAYKRTGDKRPVNALDEEMGNVGDDAKRSRYEKAYKAGKPRVLDQNPGQQLTNEKTKVKKAKGFNLGKEKKESVKKDAGHYLQYRSGSSYNRKFAEVAKLDDEMAEIMKRSSSESRTLNDKEKTRISELKKQKSDLLQVKK